MTINTETHEHVGNEGDHSYAVVQLDITSLDSAGTEPYDAAATFNWTEAWGATVLDQENHGYKFGYDPDNGNVIVKYADYDAGSDGALIDVANNTDVGTVTLKFQGNPAPSG